MGRLNYPAKGLLGGGDGSLNLLYFNDEVVTRGWGRYELAPGDTFRKVNPGGGGLYSPLLRSPESVLEDVLEGFVSEEAAGSVYGVEIKEGKIKRLLPPAKILESDKPARDSKIQSSSIGTIFVVMVSQLS